MSGFGGYGGQFQDLFRQLQGGMNDAGTAGDAAPPQAAPPQLQGPGPGEPNNFNYGQMGGYNSLAQDMSRNVMGGYGFNNGMFNYSPYGNPYMQQPGPAGGGGGQPPGYPSTQPPIMGGGGGFGGYGGGFGGRYGGGRPYMMY